MSVIRLSKSEPDEWMLRANSICFGGQITAAILRQLLAENQNGIQRRAQFVRHVREELGFVLRSKRELRRFFFERATRLLHFAVLAFHLDVLLGELPRFLRELLVRLREFLLLRLQLDRELLRLLQQTFGSHRRFDRVQHDADRLGQLLEESDVRDAERMQRGEFDHRLRLAFEQHRQHHDARGNRLAQTRVHARVTRRNVVQEDAFFLHRALANQTFAQRNVLRLTGPLRVTRQQTQHRNFSSSANIW